MTLLLIASLFLPLFPLSIVFNGALTTLRHPAARGALLLLWPQLGIGLLQLAPHAVPPYFVPWALLTSGLYALRLLTVRDMGGGLASSRRLASHSLGRSRPLAPIVRTSTCSPSGSACRTPWWHCWPSR